MKTHCKFKTPSGQACTLPAEKDDLCYWHNDAHAKSTQDLKEKLEAHVHQFKKVSYLKLHNTDLVHINLVNHGCPYGYELTHTDFYRANLQHAHFFNINLSFSSLMKADLRNANLHNANLEHTNLLGVKLDNAKLEGVKWGEMLRQE